MNENNDVFPVDENDTDVAVTIDIGDGKSLECEIIMIFETDDSTQNYIALLPVDKSGNPLEEYGVLLYRYAEDEKTGAPSIADIESDEELAAASEAYRSLVEEEL